jgi:hemerythrin superfamily protein
MLNHQGPAASSLVRARNPTSPVITNDHNLMGVMMKVFEVLKQDHQELKELFDAAGQTADVEELEQLFNKIASQLELHTHLEETIFYPALEKYNPLKDMVAEALAEHEDIEALLEDMQELDADSEEFESQLEILMASVQHHVAEEEGEMFPKVMECVDATELENLGKHLESFRGTQQRQAV